MESDKFIIKIIQGKKVYIRKNKQIKKFKCDLCDKAYIAIKDLIGHKNSHTGEKPF